MSILKKIFVNTFFYLTIMNFTYANDAVTSLVNELNYIQNFSAKFSQKIINSNQNFTKKEQGEIFIKKPNFFKWVTFSNLGKKVLVSNGKKLYNYDEILETVTIKKVEQDINQVPYLLLLTGKTSSINKLFTVTKNNNNSYTLTPKDTSLLTKIEMSFNRKHYLTTLIITSSLGQISEINFYNQSFKNIQSSVFDFQIPKNVDVFGS